MGQIHDIRTRIAQHRDEFEERKKVEYLEESRTIQTELHLAIRDAYLAGISVTNICREYGTKDRNTILTILKSFPGVYEPKPGRGRPKLYGGLTPRALEELEPEDTAHAVQWLTDSTVQFTHEGTEVVLEAVDTESHTLRQHTDSQATPAQRADLFKARGNPDHWVWALLAPTQTNTNAPA